MLIMDRITIDDYIIEVYHEYDQVFLELYIEGKIWITDSEKSDKSYRFVIGNEKCSSNNKFLKCYLDLIYFEISHNEIIDKITEAIPLKDYSHNKYWLERPGYSDEDNKELLSTRVNDILHEFKKPKYVDELWEVVNEYYRSSRRALNYGG